jgi:hypothetical protein
MATTTNYNWTTPDDTDLVKDGAAAIRTLGTAIDTSFAADEGDLLVGGTSDIFEALPIGAVGTVLTSDGDTAEWAAPASAGANWTLLNSGGTALTGAATVTVSGISAKDKILVLVSNASSANASSLIRVRFNADAAGNYLSYGYKIISATTFNGQNFTMYRSDDTGVRLGVMGSNAGHLVSGYCYLTGCNASGVKAFDAAGGGEQTGGTGNSTQELFSVGGVYNSATVISSISVNSSTGNLDAGTVFVYTSE